MDENHLRFLDSNDGHLLAKNMSIQSFNQSTDQIKENKREMYSKLYYAFSLIFAIFMTLFSQFLKRITFLVILDVFLLVLVFYAKKFYTRRRELAEEHEKIRKNLNEWNMNIKPL